MNAVNALNISNPDYGHELWNNLAEEYACKLVGVIDGDSIEVLHNRHPERIRLNGIDCPEKVYGQ